MKTPALYELISAEAMMGAGSVAQAIAHVKTSALELGYARVAELKLEDERALVKHAAIKRLMEAGAGTSVSACEKIVELDEGYSAHRAKQFDAVLAVEYARGVFYASGLRAKYALQQASEATAT